MLLARWAAAVAAAAVGVGVGLPGASGAEGWQSSVVTLTESNFERTVRASEVLLVEFYGAPVILQDPWSIMFRNSDTSVCYRQPPGVDTVKS